MNPAEHTSNDLTLSCQNNYEQKLSDAIHNGLISTAVVYLKEINDSIYSFYCDTGYSQKCIINLFSSTQILGMNTCRNFQQW